MRPITVTVAGPANVSQAIGLDHNISPQQVSVQLAVTGTVTCVVERTASLDPTDAGTKWVADGASFSADAVLTMGTLPATFVRVRTTAGTGSVTAIVLQAGAPVR